MQTRSTSRGSGRCSAIAGAQSAGSSVQGFGLVVQKYTIKRVKCGLGEVWDELTDCAGG